MAFVEKIIEPAKPSSGIKNVIAVPVALRQKRWDSFSIQAEKHLKFPASISEVGSQGQVNFVLLSVPLGLKLILTYVYTFFLRPFLPLSVQFYKFATASRGKRPSKKTSIMLSALLTCTLPDMENLLDTSRILDYQNKNFLSSPDCALRQTFVTIVYPVRTAASQAAKTSSNLVGDAKKERVYGFFSVNPFFFSTRSWFLKRWQKWSQRQKKKNKEGSCAKGSATGERTPA